MSPFWACLIGLFFFPGNSHHLSWSHHLVCTQHIYRRWPWSGLSHGAKVCSHCLGRHGALTSFQSHAVACNYFIFHSQDRRWWNKRDNRVMPFPSRLDLGKWTLALSLTPTSGTVCVCPPARLFVIIKQPNSKEPHLMQQKTPQLQLHPWALSENVHKAKCCVKKSQQG